LLNHFHKPRPAAWFFFLAAFATTIVLGSWQVKRLAWKETVLAEIEAAKKEAPLTRLPQSAEELEAKNFFPVALEGSWVPDREFHISPRFYKSTLGYFVITPFKLTDGRYVLVNRGWVPAKQKKPESRPASAVNGKATIHGMIRTGDERNWMTPPNDVNRNIWFGRDVADMAAHAKITPVAPAMVDIVGVQDDNVLPVPSDGHIKLRNDHLSYIITWYGIALGILVIFLVYHRKK
jgi:surfeit locus 1 family protein